MMLVAAFAATISVGFVLAALDHVVAPEMEARSTRARNARVPDWARRRFEAADVDDPASSWRRGRRIMGIVLLASLALTGPIGVLCIALVVGLTLMLLSMLTSERRVRRVEAELPPAVESIARGLRGGASVHAALARCADDGSGVGRDLAQLIEAPTLSVGLANWVEEQPIRSVELTAAALAVGTATGAGLARALDQFSLGLRVRSDTRAEARALSTQARASAGLLAVAPLVFLAVMAVTDPRIVTFLVGSAAGWACLMTALVLDAGAAAAMISMTRIDR